MVVGKIISFVSRIILMLRKNKHVRQNRDRRITTTNLILFFFFLVNSTKKCVYIFQEGTENTSMTIVTEKIDT